MTTLEGNGYMSILRGKCEMGEAAASPEISSPSVEDENVQPPSSEPVASPAGNNASKGSQMLFSIVSSIAATCLASFYSF